MTLNALFSNDVEFVADTKTMQLAAITGGKTITVDQLINSRSDVLIAVLKHMREHKECEAVLHNHFGCQTLRQKVHQYIWCTMGGIGFISDYDVLTGAISTEEWNCGRCGTCPGYGVVCERSLTRTEYAVAIELVQGATDKEISIKRNVSVNTVRNQHSNILNKFKVWSLAVFMRKCFSIGLI